MTHYACRNFHLCAMEGPRTHQSLRLHAGHRVFLLSPRGIRMKSSKVWEYISLLAFDSGISPTGSWKGGCSRRLLSFIFPFDISISRQRAKRGHTDGSVLLLCQYQESWLRGSGSWWFRSYLLHFGSRASGCPYCFSSFCTVCHRGLGDSWRQV